jgi:hypothetical protein
VGVGGGSSHNTGYPPKLINEYKKSFGILYSVFIIWQASLPVKWRTVIG